MTGNAVDNALQKAEEELLNRQAKHKASQRLHRRNQPYSPRKNYRATAVTPRNEPKNNETSDYESEKENRTMAKNDKTTTISKESLQKLKNDIRSLTTENNKLKSELLEKNSELKQSDEENREFFAKNQTLTKDRDDWKKKFGELMLALKDTGKAASFEQKKDVKDKINGWIKEFGFRNTKFAQSDGKLDQFTGDCYEALAEGFGWHQEATHFPKSEFVCIYKAHCAAQLSLRRQCDQSQLQKAAQVWWKKHGSLPSIDQLKKVYAVVMTEGSDFTPEEELLFWYTDEFLPHAAGHEHFGPTIRQYQMAVAKKTLADNTQDPHPNVTIPSEAFGLTMYENCREKWEAIFKWRDANGWGKGTKLPKYEKDDPTHHALHTNKWSDSKKGKGSGWDPTAGKVFNQYCKTIQSLRKADRKEGWKKYNTALQLVRAYHQVTEQTYSKKRRRKEVTPAAQEIEWEDEEDEWSVGSDSTEIEE